MLKQYYAVEELKESIIEDIEYAFITFNCDMENEFLKGILFQSCRSLNVLDPKINSKELYNQLRELAESDKGIKAVMEIFENGI